MQRTNTIGYVYVFLAILLWSTLEIAIKLIQNTTSAILINLFRWVIGSLFFLVYIKVSRQEKSFWWFFRKYPQWYIPGAFFGLVLGMLGLAWGTTLTDASIAATIVSGNPIIISLYMLTIGKERRTFKKIFGIILGFLGMLIIVTELDFTQFMSKENVIGNLIVLFGMVFWCVHIIIGKRIIGKKLSEDDAFQISNLDYNGVTFIVAGLLMVPFLLIPGEIATLSLFTWQTWLGMLYLGIFTSGIAYLFFFKGLEKIEASRGINLFYLKPIIATMFAILLIHEIPTLYFFIGIAIEVIALIFISQ